MRQRFDVVYKDNSCTIEPHFCREWDESGGCYGSNESHGYSFEEACRIVSDWHKSEAEEWAQQRSSDAIFYIEQEARLATNEETEQ